MLRAAPRHIMAIDSVRLLTDSAVHVWRGLSHYGSIETLTTSNCFDEWIGTMTPRQPLNRAEEQLLRRDYRRLTTLIAEIETLVRSRTRAIDLVRTQSCDTTLVS